MLSLPGVRFLPGTSVTGYDQTDEGVVVHCEDVGDHHTFDLSGAYLVGCDGGSSTIRKAMGVRLTGDAEIARTRTTLIRSPQVKALFGDRRPAWMSWIANHEVLGNVVAIDGEELWLVHRALPLGTTDFTALDADQSIRDALGVGPDVEYEVVKHEDWVGWRLVSERFRDGRVFIAGDAAHLWVPFAGYGMNAGIADAMNLSWLLCATLDGWASPGILDAYEAERLPITDQVSRFAMTKLQENADALTRRRIPKLLSRPGPVARLLRQKLGKRLFTINLPQMSPEGLNFGYYEQSPIIVPDREQAPLRHGIPRALDGPGLPTAALHRRGDEHPGPAGSRIHPHPLRHRRRRRAAHRDGAARHDRRCAPPCPGGLPALPHPRAARHPCGLAQGRAAR